MLGPGYLQYVGCSRAKGTGTWYMTATNFFHICAAYVRSPQAENYNNCTDTNHGGERGKGIYTYNGLPTMDIGYVFSGDNYVFPQEAQIFYDQITTVGTTFRFREDPDGVVYKVTNSRTSGQSVSNTNGHIGNQHTYADKVNWWNADKANCKVRFSVSFEDVNQPGTVFNGPSGYNVIGGKSTTKTTGVQELGYWGGKHNVSNLGGGGDDNNMVVPMPPGYGSVSTASCSNSTTYTDVDGNTVTAIKQARRWRQHTGKFHIIEIVEEITDDDADFSSKIQQYGKQSQKKMLEWIFIMRLQTLYQ